MASPVLFWLSLLLIYIVDLHSLCGFWLCFILLKDLTAAVIELITLTYLLLLSLWQRLQSSCRYFLLVLYLAHNNNPTQNCLMNILQYCCGKEEREEKWRRHRQRRSKAKKKTTFACLIKISIRRYGWIESKSKSKEFKQYENNRTIFQFKRTKWWLINTTIALWTIGLFHTNEDKMKQRTKRNLPC